MAAKTKKDESCTGATDLKEKEQQTEVQNSETTENPEEVKSEEATSEETKPEGEELSEEGAPEESKEELSEEPEEKPSEEPEEAPEEMEDEKQVLVAVYPILYESHQYKVGDKLPASNAEMVEAWTEAGTAKFIADKPKRALKATPASAQAGVEGLEGTSTDGKLLGRV